MAEDLQNPTWKYFVIHHTALLDVRPNRDGESTFWQQREHKKREREREISALSNHDQITSEPLGTIYMVQV